jgi:uncharacterized protein (TIGR04255 family)
MSGTHGTEARVTDGPSRPLQEAVFELYPSSSPGWSDLSYKRLAEVAGEKFAGPKDALRQMGVEFQLGPDATTPPAIKTPPIRHRLWTPDRGEMFQFAPDVCAYNVMMSHYTHFENHVPEMRRLFDAYLNEAHPNALTLVGQRYINKFLIEKDDQPERYFQFYPRLPSAQAHRLFALQVATETFEGGQVVVNLVHRGEEGGSAAYFLDIYAQGPTSSVEPSVGSVVAWQERAHQPVRRAFMMALTKGALERWWGEP